MEVQPTKLQTPQPPPTASALAPSQQPGGLVRDAAAVAASAASAPGAATATATREVAPSDAEAGSAAPSAKDLREAIDKIEKVVKPVAQDLKFSIDDETGKTVVKVIDTDTKEVIRQIPSEELMQIARALDKLQGLLVKQKV